METVIQVTPVKSASKTIATKVSAAVIAMRKGLVLVQAANKAKSDALNKFIEIRKRVGVSPGEMTKAETMVKNLHRKEIDAKKSLEAISKTVDSARAKVHEQKAIFQSKKKALELASKMRAQSEADKKVKEETSKIAKAKVELHVAKMKGDVTRIDQYSQIITESSVIVTQTIVWIEEMDGDVALGLEKAEVAKLKAYKAAVSLKSNIAKKSAMLAKTSAARVKAIASKLNFKLAVAKKAGDSTNIAILEMQVNLSVSEVSYSEETVSVSTKEVIETTTEEISYSSSTMNTIVNSKDHLLKESKRNVSIAMQDIEIIKMKLEDAKARYAKAEVKEEKRRLQAINSSSSSPSSSPSSEWSSSTSETTETLTTTIQEYEEKLPKLFKHMDVQQTKITKGVKAKARAMVKKHKTNYKNAKTILGSAKDQRLQL